MQAPSSQSYTGNKASFGSFQNIINHFPVHSDFISGFGGSGAIEFRKKKAPGKNIVIERSAKTVAKFWKWEHGYRIVNTDFVTWLNRQKQLSPQALIYCDPPYLLSSRASGKEYYEFEWTEKQHIAFLKTMKQLKCQVAISHYKCPLYDKLLKGWHFIDWQVMTHAGKKKEGLYMNYALPKQLHQYDYLGKNFTDRQRIKRKKERILTKLGKLPAQERHALISAVIEYLQHS